MRKLLPAVLSALSVSLGLLSCNTGSDSRDLRRSLSLANINSSVRPGDNFFLYANGNWYDTATILPTESRAGARLEMDYIAKAHIKSILLDASTGDHPAGSIEQQVGDFYTAGMDTVAIEKTGYDPLKPVLGAINAIRDGKDLMRFVAGEMKKGDYLLIAPYASPDDKNSAYNIAGFAQGGLGLPDRDYYLKTDDATKAVVTAYQKYMTSLFMLTGSDSGKAKDEMNSVYTLEKSLAESHRTNVELRDPQSNYNKKSLTDLDKAMPGFGWSALFTEMGVKTDSLNLAQPAFYLKLTGLLSSVPVGTWKNYLRFHVLANYAPYLSSNFENAAFDYEGKTLSGQKQLKDRWERIYMLIDGTIGEALGQLYVKKYFSPEAKQKMTELVNNLQVAFEGRIKKLDWMSDSTKQKAIEKLHAFAKKVAYPDKWKDYSKVVIKKNDFFQDIISCGRNDYNFMINKIGKPVDRSEWGMTPQTDNAYNNALFNEIVFPAGILQFPMFDVASDDALNYGGIGVVIGHEMTHGFDDQGAQYDKDGNLRNWWSKEDYDKFKAKEEQVIDLYNSFVVLDSVHINGHLTQGENTADIGGVAIAYDAFKMTKQGMDTTRIDGFTPDQRFFLSFAQTWRKKLKDEAMRQQINTDPHSPAMYRVWGALTNFDPFYKAFNVKEGDKMFLPEKDRIHIW